MDLQMPAGLARTPGALKRWVFDHIPSLKELLPQYRGLPGFEYMQSCVQNLRRAQDEGWYEVEKTVIYTVEGPKGAVDMKLLARGQRIPGQSHDSGARLCFCDTSVEPLTGLWINPHKHEPRDEKEFAVSVEAAMNPVSRPIERPEEPQEAHATLSSATEPEQVYVSGTPIEGGPDAA